MLITAQDLELYLFGREERGCKADSTCLDEVKKSTVKPREIRLGESTVPGRDVGVFSVGVVRAGTHMGPFLGEVIAPELLDPRGHNDNMWEIFDESGEILYFIDGGSSHRRSSWLSYINCARNEREQNLEVVQVGHNLFYRALKDIVGGEELLVWYGLQSCLYLGLPVSLQPTTNTNTNTQLTPSEPMKKDPPNPTRSTKLSCGLCKRGFNSRSNLKSHMRIHTKEKPFTCKFCRRSFSQSSTLRNHVRLHTGEKPYKCKMCRNSYSQLAGLRAHQRSSSHRSSTEETTPQSSIVSLHGV